MYRRDGFDLATGILAIAGDAMAVYCGLMLAVWIRFFSGWAPPAESLPPMDIYWQGAGVATLIFILVFLALGLYERPQLGSFGEKIPRIVIVAFSETDFTGDLQAIEIPVLIMHGEDDQVVPIAASAHKAIDLLPNGALKTYPGLSHGLFATHPERVNADLLEFIRAGG